MKLINFVYRTNKKSNFLKVFNKNPSCPHIISMNSAVLMISLYYKLCNTTKMFINFRADDEIQIVLEQSPLTIVVYTVYLFICCRYAN